MPKPRLLLLLGCLAPLFVRGVESLSVLTYNVNGNGVADWSTNSPQVQAIGHEVVYLKPDLLALQEIPFTNTWQMPNFVAAYLPGYFLATNSGTDGYLRSVILSRFPITRSQKWLDGVSLTNFGFDGSFTRDLFEAQISVPGFEQPLHLFTTHLKQGQTGTDPDRRAAEARAISNLLVTVFLPTNGTHPYLLTGDMNEDLARPPTGGSLAIPALVSPPTGLRLTTPLNPVTGKELTYSTRTSGYFSKRYDYILPCGLLFSNRLSSQVFHTDVLTNPPPPLATNDSATASDHAPVFMVFANPYNTPFRLLSLTRTNTAVTLRWESASNRLYRLDVSSNAAATNAWATLATNLWATSAVSVFRTNLTGSPKFLRVYRVP